MPLVSSFRGNVGPISSSRKYDYNYFGNGSNGAVTYASNTNLTSTLDGDMIVMNYTSLTVNSAVTLSTSNRCKGLLIFVQGNCTVSGFISMDSRGPSSDATSAGVPANGLQLPLKTSSNFFSSSNNLSRATFSNLFAGAGTAAQDALLASIVNGGPIGSLPTLVRQGASGGGGGPSGYRNRPGANGSNGATGQTGGGGGGQGGYSDDSGFGGSGGAGSFGSCFGGGSGGGGGNFNGVNGSGAASWGGQGGSGGFGGYGTSGGSGNPGGPGSAQTGRSGTGGLIILVVGGILTINSGGGLVARGQDGYSGGGGSGGSGGGNIVIAHRGSYTNNGTVSVNGGAQYSGNAGTSGGGGGTGSIQTIQLI